MISQDDYRFIVDFDSGDSQRKNEVLMRNKQQAARTFLNLLCQVSRDTTTQYVLTLIDDLLQEDKSRIDIFKEYTKKRKEAVWAPFLNCLNRLDGFIVNMASRIIAKFICWSTERMEGSDLHFYLSFLRDQIVSNSNEYVQTSGRCLQMVLRIEEYKAAWIRMDGIRTLVTVLRGKLNFQLQYQYCFCLWVITFNPEYVEEVTKHGGIPVLSDILNDSQKDKVRRIVLAVCRNLVEKVEDWKVARFNCIQMVQCKILKHLDLFQQSRFDDEELVADIEFLSEKLQASVQDLSSFEEYATEVRSGRLDWSPVHKSERFWRENAPRLIESQCELLKILVHLLESSKDPLVLSVAAYDVGEFVRHYPRGKSFIEQLGGKELVMQLLTHENPGVRYESLLALQKLMVHNWEYLGKQLKDTTEDSQKRLAV
ncbi:hypothetical protein QYM36_004041 [Artemia franciscana]|nr:hypothetical protein QYM36_004041 [Artemia franciscana]